MDAIVGGHSSDAGVRTAAVVLAGGRSSRFGSDKTRAVVRGTTLLERVLDVAGPLVDEVVVVGHWAPPGVRMLHEPTPDLGPLAGLAHGLRHVAADHALVLAGDHPLLEPALLRLLLARGAGLRDAGGSPDAVVPDAVVPLGPDGPEPLVACYRTALADAADERIARGRRSVRGFLETLQVDLVDRSVWSQVDPDGRSFLDIDSAEDLTAIEWPAGS